MTPKNIIGQMIRPATTEDIPLIRALAKTAFYATYRNLLSPEQVDYMFDWMYSADSLRRQMAEGHAYFIGAVDGIECAYLSVQQEAEDVFHLQKIYILPDYQSRGMGKELFNHALKHIKKLHPAPCQMRLNVNRHNTRAIEFYTRMGMYELERGDFPIGRNFYMTDYIMAIEL